MYEYRDATGGGLDQKKGGTEQVQYLDGALGLIVPNPVLPKNNQEEPLTPLLIN